ncbi:hypothetical protein PRZ48_010418 [Zasmidium cellare]|uniref:Xaa-Pro dipeptidyl-peptidase-like domain-containing protein n=1 Tax=Zasmidium cellare TaxID=395010 RepID=A0ABR0E8K9_ZASCE|nr:hypothetical protein PRZ48_010418 [Zasmidium cellare]
MATEREVEFAAFDGTILRGILYLPERRNAPGVVRTAGFTFLKHNFVAQVAKHFQAAGYAALIYDHRSWGSSSGTPRHNVNFFTQAADYSDAVTYLTTMSSEVDPDRIAIWGAGHAGGVVMLTSALDSRVKASVLAMPFFSGERDSRFWPEGLWDRVWDERTKCHGESEGEYVPIFAESREEADVNPEARLIGSAEAYDFWKACKQMSDEMGVEWENKVLLQSLFHMRHWEPNAYLPQLKSPVLWIMPKREQFTSFETHVGAFHTIKAPKEALSPGSGNLHAFTDTSIFDSVVQQQIDWLDRTL